VVTSPGFGASDTSDYLFHPLCLHDVFFDPEQFDLNKPLRCDSSLLKQPVEVISGTTDDEDRYLWSDLPKTEDGWRQGGIGYEIFKIYEMDNRDQGIVMTVTFNEGGTGNFGMIALAEKLFTSSDIYLSAFRFVGDRCNDGYPTILSVDEEGMVYSTAATPFRLLNPADDTNWRVMRHLNSIADLDAESDFVPLGGWAPYDDVANAAASCAGERVYRLPWGSDNAPELVGITIDTQRWLEQTQGAVQSCLNQWVESSRYSAQSHHPQTFISMGEWDASLSLMAAYCGQ